MNFNGLGMNLGNISEVRSEEHTSELQSRFDLVCRLLLEKKKNKKKVELIYIAPAVCHLIVQSHDAVASCASSTTSNICIFTACCSYLFFFFFFLNDPAPPEIYPLPLHAPLPI